MKEPVGILQLVSSFAAGGAEGQFVARVRGLHVDKRWRQVVACLNRAGPNLDPIRRLGYEPEELGLRGRVAQLNTGAQVLRLAALIEREDIRLVHANDFYAGMLALPAAKLAGVRVICSRFELSQSSSRTARFAEAVLCRNSDAVLVNAGAVRDLVVDEDGVDPAKVSVVHDAIDLAAFDAAKAREPSDAIPAGRPTIAVLDPVKDDVDVLDAVDRLRQRMPEVLVLFIGEAPMRAALEAQLDQRGLRDTALLFGDRAGAPALLGRANVGVVTSQATSALLETMAAALPAVVAGVSGNADLVADGDTGLVVPRAPDALCDALEKLLRDSALAARLGAAGRKRVEAELTVEAMARKTGALYEKVLAPEPVRTAA